MNKTLDALHSVLQWLIDVLVCASKLLCVCVYVIVLCAVCQY
jgi:hypothetical protein